MKFEIKYTLPVNQELKRILNECIVDSVEQLKHHDNDMDHAVHEFRKNMKKIRAVLRMVRYGIRDSQYAELNVFYRDLSRQFASLREAKVHIDTLCYLMKKEKTSAEHTSVYKIIQAHYQETFQYIKTHNDFLVKIQEELQHSKQWIDELPLVGKDFNLVYKGFRRSYKRGRRALQKVKKTPEAEYFHDWRKRVKYLWYHLQLLQNAWPQVMKGYNKSLDKLSDYLGLEHDLAELARLNSDSDMFKQVSLSERKVLDRQIKRNRAKIQSKTWSHGEKLYVEKPGDFTDRFAAYWKVAQKYG